MGKKIRFLIISLFVSTQVFASGFQINEHGARGMAMAGAFTALALDGSALFYNPAGLSQLDGTQIMLGTTLISPSATFRGVAPGIDETAVDAALFTPINLYITHKLENKWAFGFGINNQFGLGTNWDKNWIGQNLAIDTELQTFYFTGGASYMFSDKFSLGVTASYVYGHVAILKNNPIDPFEGTSTVDMSGNGGSFAYGIGLLYKPSKMVSIGLDFRSETTLEFSGTAETTAPDALAGLLPSGDIEAPVTLPMNATFGLAIHPSPELTISGDFQYIGWSSYDKMEITFTETGYVSTAIRDYDDSYIIRLGAEYHLSDQFDLRGGLLYDNNPVKDEWVEPSLPDSDRLGFNIGVGYKITESIAVDLAYMFLRFTERTIENSSVDYTGGVAAFDGTYNSYAHLLGLNFSYYIN